MEGTSITYITDVEGNLDYFRSVVRNSKSVFFADKEETVLDLKDGGSLVFGGDSGDKGVGSIRIVQQLVDLKKRYPDRVVFILGNRDVNKLRWSSELTSLEMSDLDGVPGPSWVPADKRISPKEFLTRLLKQTKPELEHPTAADYLGVNTVANRIRWMLKDTMGSEGDFDRRRAEVAALSGREPAAVTDEEVVDSFCSSIAENAPLREFLFMGQLAHIANGTLFVHGGLTVENLGYVPEVNESEPEPDMRVWAGKLNDWLQRQLAEWVAQPTWDNDKRNQTTNWAARGGNRVLAYTCPGSEPTVVYTHMLGPNFNPVPPPAPVAAALKANKLTRVCVGHQPVGTAPTIVKGDGVEFLCADTSYSDMKAPDNRGVAYATVEILPSGVAIVEGVLPDGKKIAFSTEDALVGRSLAYKEKVFWVKARLETDEYLISTVEGFRATYETLKKEDLQKLL